MTDVDQAKGLEEIQQQLPHRWRVEKSETGNIDFVLPLDSADPAVGLGERAFEKVGDICRKHYGNGYSIGVREGAGESAPPELTICLLGESDHVGAVNEIDEYLERCEVLAA